ncbi:MAG: M48 family metallopeptidase [Betaproteobacteria bacterium]|nr:M48 family metallopeptidase [Betaproteobacteria bacterium]
MPSVRPTPRREPAPPLRRLAAGVLALALALQPLGPGVATLAQAQRLPDLGDESEAGVTPSQERKLGEAIVGQIRAAGGYLDDPEVNDYLNELGNRLVAVAADRFDFEFFAVPDPGINAFALPGGFIGVNTGLVLLAQSESELASVLAHEITHVTQRHYTRSLAGQQRSLLYSLAALAVAVAASRSGSSSAGQATSAAIASSQALAIQTQLNYTREHEYEADRIGYQRLVSAGFDPNSMAVFMDRLQKSGRFSDSNAPSYLRSHPITYERVAEAQARAHGEPYRQVRDSLDFHLVRALLRSYTGTDREAVAYFRAALADRKFNNPIATRYGLVAALLRARDIPRAKQELATLEQEAPAHPMIDAMAGHVLLEAGEFPAAVTRFEQALAKYPNKMQLVYDYPDALNKAGRGADAVAFVELQLVRFPGIGPLHRIAARVYGAQGKRLLQHRHQGEYYAWAGDLRGAVLQMELAAKAADGDFYQSSVVETRLRALRRDLAEQQAAMAKSG